MPFFQSLGGSPAPVNTMKGCDALGRSNVGLNSKDSRLLPRSVLRPTNTEFFLS